MDDLITRLRAALDDHESAALGAKGDTGGRWTQDDGPPEDIVLYDKSGKLTMGQARHIARHDPAFVLADIAAKRKLLDMHAESDFPYNPDDGPGDYSWTARCDRCYEDTPCTTLRLLAEAYGITA